MPSEHAEIDRSQRPLPPPPLPPMILSWLERKALRMGLPVDDQAVAPFDALVLNTAQALVGPEREEVRLRMTAKALAATRARLLVLEALLDARLAAGDAAGVRESSRLVEGVRRHLVALLAEHRACDAGRRTPVKVMVGQADAVNIMAVASGR